jgi:hypothetical protein
MMRDYSEHNKKVKECELDSKTNKKIGMGYRITTQTIGVLLFIHFGV